jgi:hypothetical protein
VAIEKLERNRPPGINQIPEKLIKARDRTSRSEIHKLINSIWKKEELPDQWKESLMYVFRGG